MSDREDDPTRQYVPKPLRRFGGAIALFFLAGAIGTYLPVPREVIGIVGIISLIAAGIGVLDVILLARIRWARKVTTKPSQAYGGATFATGKECKDAGLTRPNGLYIGVMNGTPLFENGAAHLLTVAPSGAGKGTSVVIPNLLHYSGSAFITDPKGELAAVTARHRREAFGHDVFVLNPWGMHDLPQHRFNPLSVLTDMAADPDRAPDLTDEVKAIALQLLPEPADGRNRYFREGGRTILRAVMLYLATRDDPERCTLPQMWRIVSSTRRFKEAVTEMAGSDVLNGTLADMGEDLSHQLADNPEQFGDFRQNAVQALDIFDPSGWLGRAVDRSDVEFRDLKQRKASVYLVIPQDKVATHGTWLGLLTHRAITDVGRAGGTGSVLFMLDEFANMGKMSALAESLTALRGFGVRLWIFVQEMAHVEQIYGKAIASTIFSQAEVKQFFSVANDDMAKRISNLMGQKTVKVAQYGLGHRTDKVPEVNLSETGRPLMSPDEIYRMPADEQLIFITGMAPIRARRLPFWQVKPWREQADPNPVEGRHPTSRPALSVPSYA